MAEFAETMQREIEQIVARQMNALKTHLYRMEKENLALRAENIELRAERDALSAQVESYNHRMNSILNLATIQGRTASISAACQIPRSPDENYTEVLPPLREYFDTNSPNPNILDPFEDSPVYSPSSPLMSPSFYKIPSASPSGSTSSSRSRVAVVTPLTPQTTSDSQKGFVLDVVQGCSFQKHLSSHECFPASAENAQETNRNDLHNETTSLALRDVGWLSKSINKRRRRRTTTDTRIRSPTRRNASPLP